MIGWCPPPARYRYTSYSGSVMAWLEGSRQASLAVNVRPRGCSRRVEDHHVEPRARFAQGAQRVEGITRPGGDGRAHAVLVGVALELGERRCRAVHAQHLGRARNGGLHAPTADIAEQVEHALARHVLLHAGAVHAVIVEPTGLLAIEN